MADTDAVSPLVAPSSYADQIAHVLEQEILQGRYRRGQSLQQDEVTRRFGVSRTPAREALRKLQAIGLVELVPNKSASVQVPTLDELTEVYAVRAELEAYAASLAAGCRTQQELTRMRVVQERLADTVAGIDVTAGPAVDEQLRMYNDEFHNLVLEASGNRRLAAMVRDLERYFPKDVVRRALGTVAELERFYVADHQEVLEAIERRRRDGARRAMRTHIHRSQELLLNYLRDQGFGS